MRTGKISSKRTDALGGAPVFLGGALSVLVQTVVLRESLFGQHQAELASGMVLASWIVGSGIGAALGGRSRRGLLLWRLGVLLLPLLGYFQVAFVRLGVLPLPLTVLPLGLAAGVVFIQPFAFGPPGRIYALEAFGAAAGGGLFVLLSSWMLSGQLLAVCVTLSAAALLFGGMPVTGGVLAGLTLAGQLFSLPGLFSQALGSGSLEGYEEVEIISSPYGEVVTAERLGQHAVFRGGILEATWPSRETAEAAVVPALAAVMPESVLYIGSSPEECFILEEWPSVKGLVCIVPDDALLGTARYPQGTAAGDGRRYLDRTGQRFDLITVSAGQPLTLLSNRFYTSEFMAVASAALSSRGVLSIRLPGGANRLHPLEAELVSSVEMAAAEHFDWVRTIPMAGTTLLAGAGTPPALTGEGLAAVLDSLGFRGLYVNSRTLPFDLSPMRTGTFADQVSAARSSVNRDLHPEGFILAHRLWSERTGEAEGTGWIPFAAASLLLITTAASILTGRFRVSMGVSSAGFGGLSAETTALVAVQAATGHSWVLVGAVTGLFMTGAASGALASGKLRFAVKHYMLVSILCILTCAAFLAAYDGSLIGGTELTAVLLACTFICGAASGGAFSSAAAGLDRTGTGPIGLLSLAEYSASASAGLLMPLVLFPVLGGTLSLLSVGVWGLAWYLMQPSRRDK